MDRRESGPVKRTIDDMIDGTLSRIYEMTKDAAKRMKRAAAEMQHNIYNEIGYQSAAKARELWEDYLEKTPEPPQAERKMKNGEIQRNFMTLKVCTYCNRPFTGQEDFDDPDREGEKRPAIKCGYDLTRFSRIYCSTCKNRDEPLPCLLYTSDAADE